MSLAKQVEDLRADRRNQIESTLTRIRELLFLFPRDPTLPRQQEELELMRDQILTRTDANVIHLDEIREIYGKKHFARR